MSALQLLSPLMFQPEKRVQMLTQMYFLFFPSNSSGTKIVLSCCHGFTMLHCEKKNRFCDMCFNFSICRHKSHSVTTKLLCATGMQSQCNYTANKETVLLLWVKGQCCISWATYATDELYNAQFDVSSRSVFKLLTCFLLWFCSLVIEKRRETIFRPPLFTFSSVIMLALLWQRQLDHYCFPTNNTA